MQSRRDYLKGLVLGAVVVLGLVFLTGAIITETNNRYGGVTLSYVNVACSNDGKTVYVVDQEHVYKSTDGGYNWLVMLKKNRND